MCSRRSHRPLCLQGFSLLIRANHHSIYISILLSQYFAPWLLPVLLQALSMASLHAKKTQTSQHKLDRHSSPRKCNQTSNLSKELKVARRNKIVNSGC
ncbi:hypothetical protein AC579_6939 [Pseudocercospora musae]|uniref:Uncharacterized protein n=1 Tax=Pseudocercospora musae TaxID=113226 RepID=A0A139IN56_9PEZI|nr:hypothetical protein AC579_6939 [Pseudocercospora musae]KXT16227.1 hypothetical protein AC579_6939 [Pseudocercospora musae]KXT16228.1 hypothetical protein AC579_6939 [Pseudocercospora musae]